MTNEHKADLTNPREAGLVDELNRRALVIRQLRAENDRLKEENDRLRALSDLPGFEDKTSTDREATVERIKRQREYLLGRVEKLDREADAWRRLHVEGSEPPFKRTDEARVTYDPTEGYENAMQDFMQGIDTRARLHELTDLLETVADMDDDGIRRECKRRIGFYRGELKLGEDAR